MPYQPGIPGPDFLSAYVIELAMAAGVAHQELANDPNQPMSISEFRFKVNLSGSLTFDFSTQLAVEAKLKFLSLSVQQKLAIQYKTEWGLEVECFVRPL